jgi:hypothetical protein
LPQIIVTGQMVWHTVDLLFRYDSFLALELLVVCRCLLKHYPRHIAFASMYCSREVYILSYVSQRFVVCGSRKRNGHADSVSVCCRASVSEELLWLVNRYLYLSQLK